MTPPDPWSLRTRQGKLIAIGASALLVGGLCLQPDGVRRRRTAEVPRSRDPQAHPGAPTGSSSPRPARLPRPRRSPGAPRPPPSSPRAEILESPRALGEVAPAAGAVANVKAQSSTPVNTTLGYASTYHTVEFAGLKPATRYTYRVGDGTNWSEWNDFTTAAAGFQPFSFIYYGDAQNYIDSAVPRVFRQAFADRPQAKLIVNAGDLIDSANSEEQWGQWFKAGGFIDSQVNNLSITG